MTKSRSDRVEEAIEKIEEFYTLGGKIPAKQPYRKTYAHGVIKAEAGRRGVSDDMIRKARSFADQAEGYALGELKELKRLVRRVQPGHDVTKGVFGKTHVIRLLGVPKHRRAALQRRAIEEGWSTAELEAEIARRFGTRRAGGRRRKIPGRVDEVLTQAERLCEAWRRWHAELSIDPETNDKGHLLLGNLPELLQRLIKQAAAAVSKVQEAVAAELAQRRPGRSPRPFPERDEVPKRGPARRPKQR